MGVKTEITRSLLLARLTGTQVEVVAPGFRSTGRVTSLIGFLPGDPGLQAGEG